jgi:ribulose-phosphate 3-epimerase
MMAVQRVVPAILTDDVATLERMVRLAEGFAPWVQFDIMDGLFVPSRSLGIADIMRLSPQFAWEAHLMVRNASNYIDGFVLAGAKRIIFHYESVANPVVKARYIRSLGIEVGMAINPDTPVSTVNKMISDNFDLVLLMSVYPGYYGKPFLPGTLDKIKEIHARFPDLSIGIDGGIKEDNIQNAARAGADEICVGSAILGSKHPAESYQKLYELAKKGWQERAC